MKANIVSFFVGVLCTGFIWLTASVESEDSPRIGDVWRYVSPSNPYQASKIYDYKILDVRDGFVKSMWLKDSSVHIDPKRYYRHYELISRGKDVLILAK
jgi:hypothetical protein